MVWHGLDDTRSSEARRSRYENNAEAIRLTSRATYTVYETDVHWTIHPANGMHGAGWLRAKGPAGQCFLFVLR